MTESLIVLFVFVCALAWLGAHPEFGCPPRRPYDEPIVELIGDILPLDVRVDWPIGIAQYIARTTYTVYRGQGFRA